MKKRLMAILLSLCMLLGLLPVTALAAPVSTEADENDAILWYEITSAPANGVYYVEGEEVYYSIWLENASTDNTFTNVSLSTGSMTSIVADSLEHGESTEKQQKGVIVNAASAQAQELERSITGTYQLGEKEYEVHATVTIPTGLEAPELTDLGATRKDGEITVSFESNCRGTYAYAVLEDGATAPADWSVYTQYDMWLGQNSFTIPDAAGNKTISFMAWNVNSDPMENPASVEITDYIYTLEESFDALGETTTLPYSGTLTLGGEGSIQYTHNGLTYYGKLMKVTAEAGQMLNLDFYGHPDSLDTRIDVYRPKDGGGFTQVESFDKDNKNGNGESAVYIVPENGTYYLVFRGYSSSSTGPCNLEVSVSDAPESVTLEEGFEGLTDATLPYSGTVTLGGEGSVLYNVGTDYNNNPIYTYGQLMKVTAEAGQMLNLAFYGQSDYVGTVIEIYRQETGDIQHVTNYDTSDGNNALFLVEEEGTYYLAFLGYDLSETGMCNLEVSISDVPEIKTLEEGFEGLTDATTLPYSDTVDLGGEGSVLYNVGTDYYDNPMYTYGQLMKVEAEKGQMLNLAFYGQPDSLDTQIAVYRPQDDGGFTQVESYDRDNKNGYGESAVFIAQETGTYYLAFAGYGYYVTGLCNLEVSFIDNEAVTTERLDFTADPVPVPGEDDLWTWDADTKTLTLKDGFQMTGMVDTLICLPDGATVLVEGTAEINNYGMNSILGIGSVTIRGVDPETSSLTIGYDAEDAIELDNGGSLTVENVSMDITAGSDGIITEEDITIKNARIKINAEDEGLDPSGSAILENSEVEIYCNGKGIDATDDIIVTGGKLIIDADGNALECDYLTFAQGMEVKLKTRDVYGYDLFDVYGIDEFSISGPVALYGSDGALLYSGPWNEDLINAYNNLEVDGVQAYSIASGSMYELEITAGANGVWQKGTTEGLSFTANGAIDDFQKVQVDGKDLDASSYTIGENTTITLKPEYLETLSVGKHTLAIVFDIGTATTEFTITAADSDVCDGGEDCPAYDYDDVNKEAWYHPYVDFVIENGIMVGVSTDPYVFMPDANLTRAQAIQTLYQLEGEPATDYVTDYPDVAANQWFAKAIAWGTENGIVNGRDTGEFDPDGNITREELVTILYRYATEYKKVPVGTVPAIPETYTDVDRIGFFAVDAFAWAIDCGIVNGMTGTTLEPQGLATRAQMAKMITVFLQ